MAKQPHKGGKTQLGMLVSSLSEFGHFCIAFKLSFSISLCIVESFVLFRAFVNISISCFTNGT
jgi:hypothetical protein